MSEKSEGRASSEESDDIMDRVASAKGRGKGCSTKKAAALASNREKSAASRKVDGEMRKREAALLKKQKERERAERQQRIEEKERLEEEKEAEMRRRVEAKTTRDTNSSDDRFEKLERMIVDLQRPKPAEPPPLPKKQKPARRAPAKKSVSEDDEDDTHKVTRASASAEINRRAKQSEERFNKKARADNPHKAAGQRIEQDSALNKMMRDMFPHKYM